MAVKIARGEIEHILSLKASFNHCGALLDHAIKCLNLGWALAALETETGKELGLNFEDMNACVKRLEDPKVDAAKINLAVHTGSRSRLLVLEVANAEQRSCLNGWGAWQSQCVAELQTAGLEKHFYLLSPNFHPLWTKQYCYAEGAITLLPPSLDPFTQERWRWRQPPWDSAPSPLPGSIIDYLNSLPRPATTAPHHHQRVSWQELYCLISASEEVLQAFAHREVGLDDYYEKLFQAALEAGLTDSDLLLSLLWYAPEGDAQQRPERWAYLEKLVSQAGLEGASPSLEFLEGSRTSYHLKGLPLNFIDKEKVGRQPLSRRARKK